MILGTWLPRLPDAATGAPAGALSDAALRALLDGRPAAARELLEGRLDPGSTDGLAWFYLGIARDQGADRPGAADAYARAARLLPDDPDARFRHARCLFGAGDAWGARPHISAVVNLARNWPAAQRLMGDVAFAIGDTIRAKRAYLDLLQIEPDDAYAEAMVLRIDGTPP
jgi:tetratricopeptide (TPR) repeat protein